MGFIWVVGNICAITGFGSTFAVAVELNVEVEARLGLDVMLEDRW